MRKGNKAVSLLDTKESSGDGNSGAFFCADMVLKFHASRLYFFLIQCKPRQWVCLTGHKQRDVQYIVGQPQVIRGETDVELDFIWEQLLRFTGSGPAFIKVKIKQYFQSNVCRTL